MPTQFMRQITASTILKWPDCQESSPLSRGSHMRLDDGSRPILLQIVAFRLLSLIEGQYGHIPSNIRDEMLSSWLLWDRPAVLEADSWLNQGSQQWGRRMREYSNFLKNIAVVAPTSARENRPDKKLRPLSISRDVWVQGVKTNIFAWYGLL